MVDLPSTSKRLEMCKRSIETVQALMEPNKVKAPEQKVLIHKEREKQEFKEFEQVNGPKLDTILSLDHRVAPNTTDDAKSMTMIPISEVKELWPQSFGKPLEIEGTKVRPYRTEVSMESKPQSLRTLPSFIDEHETKLEDATSPKQAWDRLVSVDTTNTIARKIQLKNELNTVKKENLSINDYTLKIKGIVESLASIGVQVEDDDKVEIWFLCWLLKRRTLVKMHLLHKAEIILSRSSTQTEVEVEDVVQAKDEVVVVETKIKASSSINQMIHNGQTIVDVEIIEAGVVKEVAKTTKEIMQIMKIENAGVVEERVILNMTVHQETRVAEDNKTIMHLLARM
ncbi:hypothetical protein L7F22_056687 [Adiantum nelumboides]|nr:hypothetical protein [Adiantum nelumboides]